MLTQNKQYFLVTWNTVKYLYNSGSHQRLHAPPGSARYDLGDARSITTCLIFTKK